MVQKRITIFGVERVSRAKPPFCTRIKAKRRTCADSVVPEIPAVEPLVAIREALKGVPATEEGGFTGNPYVDAIGTLQADAKVLRRRVASLERQLVRANRFSDAADMHIPALLAGENADPERWRAAVEWWKTCTARVGLSSEKYPPSPEAHHGPA